MKFVSLAAIAALAAAVAAPAFAADVVNGGFESGDLTGWTAFGAGSVGAVSSSSDYFGITTFAPSEGAFFAQIVAGADDDYTTLSQSFTLASAGTVSLDAIFVAFDETGGGFDPYNDDGYVRIFNQATSEVIFQSDVNSVGDYGHTSGLGGQSDWTHLVQALGPGTYTLEAGVRNVGDDLQNFTPGSDSQLLLDNVQITAGPAPEPATWALLLVGFGGLGAALRRRRPAASAA